MVPGQGFVEVVQLVIPGNGDIHTEPADGFELEVEELFGGGLVEHALVQGRIQLREFLLRGSGFQKITTHTSELRLYSKDLAPSFESDASSFFTTVYSVLYGKTDADFKRIIDEESTPKTGNTTQNTIPKTENSTPKTTPKKEESTPKKLGATAQSILDVLSEDPYLKREEIAERVGLKLEGLKYQLGQLQKKGYLLRVEGRKTGRWKVLIKK